MKFNDLEIFINDRFEIALLKNGMAICVTQDQADLVADALRNLKSEAKLLEAENE